MDRKLKPGALIIDASGYSIINHLILLSGY